MDISLLKEEFYKSMTETLKNFSAGEENKDVYAIVLDCDSSVGMVVPRYRNRKHFEDALSSYEEYKKKYGWEIYGLHGGEYDPGEFPFLEYKQSKVVRHFTDSYYFYEVGEYYGEGEPIEGIEDNYREIFWDMIVDTINRLKDKMDELGVHTADKFIMFHCDHDQSYEERDKMISMTVDEELMKSIG